MSIDAVSIATVDSNYVANKDLCAWNYEDDGKGENGQHLYKCRKCGKGKIVGNASGYKNLISHVCTCYGVPFYNTADPNFKEAMQPIWQAYKRFKDAEKKGLPTVFDQAVPRKVSSLHGWIRLVVFCNNPISICDNPVYRELVKMDRMTHRTLRKYIIMLADIVGLKIRESIEPGNCIADGWSCADTHFFAVVHRWPTLKAYGGGTIETKQALLSCAPFINERSLDANSTAESIQAAYDMYGDDDESDHSGSAAKRLIVCFTLDNTNVNPKVADKMNKPMIGAHCHQLNLAAKHWMCDAYKGNIQKDLDSIGAVMLHASTLKGRGALKEFTPYVPEKQNKTRWTGYQDMALKYSRIHDALEKTGMYDNLGDTDKETVAGSAKENADKQVLPELLSRQRLKRFNDVYLPALTKLRQWFKNIQHPDITLDEAQAYFKAAGSSSLFKGHSDEFTKRLSPDHKLVVAKDFESAVLKIIEHEPENITEEEAVFCDGLLKTNFKHIYPDAKEKEPNQTTEDVAGDDSDIEMSPTKLAK